MRSSVTFVFFALFAAVAGFYVYLTPRAENAPEALPATGARLLPFEDHDTISSLEIENAQKNLLIRLQREGSGWRLTDPVAYPADDSSLEGLLTALSASRRARRLVPEKGWQEYGLEKPSIRIGIRTLLADRKRHLLLGDPSPVGDYIYARWEGEDEYFLLSPEVKAAFDRSVYALRLKRVFKATGPDISKVHFRIDSREFEIARYGEQWFWMQPISILGVEVNREFLTFLLTQLTALSVKEFLDEEKVDPEDLGLSGLGAFIRVAGPGPDPEIVYLGDEMPARDAYFARREGDQTLFLVARANVASLWEAVRRAAEQAR